MSNIDLVWLNQTNNTESNFVVSPFGYYKILYYLNHFSEGKQKEEIAKIVNQHKGDIENSSFGDKNYLFLKDVYQPILNQDSVSKIPKKQSLEIKGLNEAKNFDVGDISEDTIAIILNKLVFDQKWNDKFVNTTERFFNYRQESKDADFIHSESDFDYYEDSEIEILRVNFENDYYINIFLPKGSLNYLFFDGIEKQLKKSDRLTYQNISAYIPKFKFDYDLDLIPTTKSLGIHKIFDFSKDWNLVDFSKLKSEALLKVSQIEQKSKIILDDIGTKAESTTFSFIATTGCLYMSYAGPAKKVIVDRPFAFTVNHKECSIPLFLGCVKEI